MTSQRLQSVHTSRSASHPAGGRLARSHSPHSHLRPASPPMNSVTAIPSATSARLCLAACLPNPASLSFSITRMMASPAPSLSKIGRLAARLRVMRVLAASPRSGWSAPIVSGRDAFELLRIWRVFECIGVALRATDENIDDPFYFDIHAVIAANERRKFLERSAEGMNRAAKRRPLHRRHRPARLLRSQGIVAPAVLFPDDSPMWERPLRR